MRKPANKNDFDALIRAHEITSGAGNRLMDIPVVPSVVDWAHRHRMLPAGVTAKPGPYDVSLTPYMREPMEMLDHPDVAVSCWCFAKRLGKTEGELNLIGRTLHLDPKNILVVYPDLDKARKWRREFFNPMVENSSVFRGLISDPRKKDGENTMLSVRFPGGRATAVGANSPSSFRQIQAPLVLLDEVDAMMATREGDPIELAFGRAENYADCIQLVMSTPTIKGESRIWKYLEESDFRKYFVPSPFSGKFHVLDFANVKWQEGKPETAVYVDPDTDQEWIEAQRKDAIMSGEWRATQEFTGVRGYWGNGLLSLFPPKKGFRSKPHQWAAEFLNAKRKGNESLQVWKNTFACEPWEEEYETTEWEDVRDRAEEYEVEPVPDRVLLVTLGADIQADRIEFEWVGWGEDFESWGLRYGIIPGDTKRPETWHKLEQELMRRWNHPSEWKLQLDRAFIDEGFRPEFTRKFCLEMLQKGVECYPVRGMPRNGVREPELVTFKANRQQKGIKAPTFDVGTTRAKRTIYGHILEEPPGPNTMHFPRGHGYNDNYFQMLTAEQVKTKYSYGQPYKVFECPQGKRNEALDCRVYAYGAAYSLNPDWEGLYRNRSYKEPQKPVSEKEIQDLTESETRPMPEEKPARRRANSTGAGYVNSY